MDDAAEFPLLPIEARAATARERYRDLVVHGEDRPTQPFDIGPSPTAIAATRILKLYMRRQRHRPTPRRSVADRIPYPVVWLTCHAVAVVAVPFVVLYWRQRSPKLGGVAVRAKLPQPWQLAIWLFGRGIRRRKLRRRTGRTA